MNTIAVWTLILVSLKYGCATDPHDPIHAIPDTDLSYEQWLTIGKEVLTLKINAYNLRSSSSVEQMATTLYNHFHQNATVSITTSTNSASANASSASNPNPSVRKRTREPSPPPVDADEYNDQVTVHDDNQAIATNLVAIIQEQIAAAIPSVVNQILNNRPTSGFDAVGAPVRGPQNVYNNQHGASNEELFSFPDLATEDGTPLPPLPQEVIRRIQLGKFVNFDKLLPFSAIPDHGADGMHMEASIGSRDGCLIFSRKDKVSAKVVSFNSWTLAWSVFALYFTFFHGRFAQLMGYFNRAAELANKHPWREFSTYDVQFRLRMACNHNNNQLKWDRVDEDLRSRYLRSSQPMCQLCFNFGHYANQCPGSSQNSQRSFVTGPMANSSGANFNGYGTVNQATRGRQSHDLKKNPGPLPKPNSNAVASHSN